MGHQRVVCAVVATKFCKVVGKWHVPPNKIGRKTGQTGVYGIAPCVDDASIRQCKMYETDQMEVVQPLIDNSLSGWRVASNASHIARAYLAQLHSRIFSREMQRATLCRGIPKSSIFSGTEDFWVTAKQLFDQGTSRSRQTDNEHGSRGRVADTLVRLNELAVNIARMLSKPPKVADSS